VAVISRGTFSPVKAGSRSRRGRWLSWLSRCRNGRPAKGASTLKRDLAGLADRLLRWGRGGSRSRITVTAGGFQHSEKTVQIERLRQDFAHAELLPQRLVGETARADDEDRDVAQRGICELFRAKVPPVHDRHHHVEYDRVDSEARAQVAQGIDAVACRHHQEALAFEELRNAVEDPKVIVDEQYLSCLARRGKLNRCPRRPGFGHKTTADVLRMSGLVQPGIEVPKSKERPG
jgi:hypothetical protein